MEFDSVRFKKFMHEYGKSEVIFEEGSFGSEMYVVRSGRVRIYRVSAEGEIEVGIVKQGEFFGEMALVDNTHRSASACALEDDTRLIALDKDKFLFLISQQPTFALEIMHALCKRIRSLSESVFPAG
ncbi:MAG: Crp/Fnr family transcriptional regulator [Syntrophobacteraceae bacterium]